MQIPLCARQIACLHRSKIVANDRRGPRNRCAWGPRLPTTHVVGRRHFFSNHRDAIRWRGDGCAHSVCHPPRKRCDCFGVISLNQSILNNWHVRPPCYDLIKPRVDNTEYNPITRGKMVFTTSNDYAFTKSKSN